MSDQVQDLARRLDSLERQNRLLKRGGLVALLGAAAIGLQSFSSPAICDVVSAERIVLRNHHGKQRMVMDAYRTERPTLTFHDAKGRAASRITVDSSGGLDISVFRAGKAVPGTFTVQGSQLAIGELKAKDSETKKKSGELTGQGID